MLVHTEWRLLPERIAIHEPTATAVAADVHLGYGEARRHGGDAVPLVSVAAQLDPLVTCMKRHGAGRLLVAGDLFEDTANPHLLAEFLDCLQQHEIGLAGIVPGNHDRQLEQHADRIRLFPDGVCLGEWRIVHGDAAEPTSGKTVHGHWHPSMPWQGRRRPCFLVGARRLVLPAFSRDAAGASWRHVSCTGSLRAFVIVGPHIVAAGIVAPGADKNPRRRPRGSRKPSRASSRLTQRTD